jgi:hypothetical protein
MHARVVYDKGDALNAFAHVGRALQLLAPKKRS